MSGLVAMWSLKSPSDEGERVQVDVVVLPAHAVHADERAGELGKVHGRVHHHLPGGDVAGRDHRDGPARLGLVEVHRIDGHEEVEAQVQVGATRRHLVGALDGLGRDAQVGDHRPALLAEPGLVEAAHVLAVQERGRAQDLVDGDDAGAADPHHVQREAVGRDLEDGLGHLGLERGQPALLLLRRAHRLHGEEGRAVAEEARVVLVARGLVDLRLPPELRLHRLHGQAVGLLAAVAAALAHALVDEHARGRVDEPPALAEPPLLRRALLVVDQRGDARRGREHRLRLEEAVAVPHLGGLGPRRRPCTSRDGRW